MKRLLTAATVLAIAASAAAQTREKVRRDFNYFFETANRLEERVPDYTLPDPLLCLDGTRVSTGREWEQRRRPELLRLITDYMYGRVPEAARARLGWTADTTDRSAHGGRAVRKVYRVRLTPDADGPAMSLQLFLPKGAAGRVPVFLGLAFCDNSEVETSKAWLLDSLLAHGFGLATFRYTEVAPDKPNTTLAYTEGIIPRYYRPGQTFPMPDEWGTVAAWAWAASKALDCLDDDADVDARRVAVIGHSRLGKAALWAGAADERFAMVVSVNSGCCGAALSRRQLGETVESINNILPYWFCGNYKQFSDREQFMPFDQHEVIALVAPRPVYVASATEDIWADPLGEYLALRAAADVYRLYSPQPHFPAELPRPDEPIHSGALNYHLRTGPHAVLPFDWTQFIACAQRVFGR